MDEHYYTRLEMYKKRKQYNIFMFREKKALA